MIFWVDRTSDWATEAESREIGNLDELLALVREVGPIVLSCEVQLKVEKETLGPGEVRPERWEIEIYDDYRE